MKKNYDLLCWRKYSLKLDYVIQWRILKEILNKLYAKELNGIMYSFADILPFFLPTFWEQILFRTQLKWLLSIKKRLLKKFW